MTVAIDEREEDGGPEIFSAALQRAVSALPAQFASLDTISAALGRRLFGVLLLLLALPIALPVPLPGISILFGLPLIFVSAQLVSGRRSLWLPARVARHTLLRSDLAAIVRRTQPILRAIEHVTHPRLAAMAGEGMTIAAAAVCLLLAVVIVLPIPFGHMVPASAICVLALGLIERDGLAIVLGFIVAAFGLVIATLASMALLTMIEGWLFTG